MYRYIHDDVPQTLSARAPKSLVLQETTRYDLSTERSMLEGTREAN